MHQLTLGPAIACLLILGVCLFVLFAKTGLVAKVFNTVGGWIQSLWSKIIRK